MFGKSSGAIGLAAVVLASALAEAQPRTSSSAAPASVEGDVYIVMQSGDTKRGAGRLVRLVRDGEDLRRSMETICVDYAHRAAALKDSLAWIQNALDDSERVSLDAVYADIQNAKKRADHDSVQLRASRFFGTRLLLQEALGDSTARVVFDQVKKSTADTAGTGMNAHYRFDRVQPGKYILFGEWAIGDNDYQWWAPIDLKAGQAMKRDLDNSVEADNKLYCGIR